MESTRVTFREGSDMKVKDLLNLIENNVLDENADIQFTGVRNGVRHEGYEIWTTEDDTGRNGLHITIATEGDSDFERVQEMKKEEMVTS